MYTQKFNQLLEEYNKTRKAKLGADQFAALLYTFPSILIAHADGNIDPEERNYLRHIPSELANDFQVLEEDEAPAMNENYFSEVEYIVGNLKRWETPFLTALKEQLEESQNEKNGVFQLMWRTADSSEDISVPERKMIQKISKTLGL